MAYKSFDTAEYLIPLEHRKRSNFSHKKVVKNRRIASLLKKQWRGHIFDRAYSQWNC